MVYPEKSFEDQRWFWERRCGVVAPTWGISSKFILSSWPPPADRIRHVSAILLTLDNNANRQVTNHRTLSVLLQNVRATCHLLSCDRGKDNINMEVRVVLYVFPQLIIVWHCICWHTEPEIRDKIPKISHPKIPDLLASALDFRIHRYGVETL